MKMLQEYWTRMHGWFDFDVFLTSVGGYFGILVILAALAAIIAIALSLRNKPALPPGSVASLRRLLPGWADIRHVGRRLLDTGRYLFTSREWRYRSPWYLMVGGQASGARTLGKYLELIQRNNLDYQEKALGAQGTEWFFLNEGVVINLVEETGASELPAGMHRPWLDSIREIKQLRSERPVDGIVLAIPADVLRRGNAQELQQLADELFLKLHTIQETFEFVLPVYLVITKCDLLKGFTHFWNVQDKASRPQIFGWSSPYRIDNNFALAWIDEAFDYLVERLKEIQLQSIALDHKALREDSYYLFPSSLLPVKTRLKDVLENVFKSTKYQSNLLFRGLYFTGELSVDAGESTLPQAFRAMTDADGDGDADIPEIAFIKELFEQKIFREANLAKPSGKGIFSRDTYIRRFQIALSAFGVFLFGMLVYKDAQLDRQLAAITEVVRMTKAQQVAGLADCGKVLPAATTYPFLSNIAQLDDDLSTVFIPTSFRNDVPSRVANTLSNEGFEKILYPNLACLLKQQAAELNQPDANPALAPSDRLVAYLDAVVAFEKNRARLEAIAPHASNLVSTNMRPDRQACGAGMVRIDRGPLPACETYLDAFIAINEYVYQMPVPADLRQNPDGQHIKALQAADFSLNWSEPLNDFAFGAELPARCSDSLVAGRDTTSAFGRPISHDLIAANICMLAVAHLAAIENDSLLENYPVGGNAVGKDFIAAIDSDPAASLGVLNTWLDYVNEEWLLPGVANDPCGEMQRLLTDTLGQLTSRYGYPQALFVPIIANFGNRNCTDYLLERVAGQNIPPLGQVVMATGNGGNGEYQFAPAYAAVIPALQSLRDESWMALPDQRNFSCNVSTETWDPAYLAQIVALYQEYESYALANQFPLTKDRNNVASAIAHDKLNRVVNRLLADAQQAGNSQFYTGGTHVYRPVSDLEATISDKSRKFDIVKNDLLQILGILRKLDMNATFTGLSQCARRYALTVLDNVGNLVLDAQLYRKVPQAFSSAAPFSNYLWQLDGEGDLKEYLQDQHKRLALIAQYADPLVTFLLNTETVNGDNQRAEVMNFNYWNNTLREFNKFSQGIDQNNQLQKLDDYLAYMQGGIDTGNCLDTDLRPPNGADLGNDLFSSKRLDLQMRVIATCSQTLALGFEQQYAELAAYFNANLAGHYPFQAADAPVVSEASPQAVREFFITHGDLIDTMQQTTFLLGKTDAQWKGVDDFLMNMAALRNFFAASLSAPGSGKPLMLQFDFARLRGYDAAANAYAQIAAGTVRTGHAEVDFFAEPAPLQWSFGDSLNIDLDWARDSAYVPVLAQGSYFAQDTANPFHVMFMEGGNWALLHLLDDYRSRSNLFGALGETGTTVLEFPITLRHAADAAANPVLTAKTLLVPVTILAQDPQTRIYQPTDLPLVFPANAPALAAATRLTGNL